MRDDLERRLGYRFRDPGLLERALTHASQAHETGRTDHYERLEFLGDALLGFLAADWLYDDDDEASEGDLTRRKQSVVRTATLAGASRCIDLGGALRLGRGERATGGHAKASILADAFEAMLGAVYVDGGLRSARAFVRRHLGPDLESTRRTRDAADDFKTQLQERVQARLRRTPRYRIASASGPAHALEFEAQVLIGDEVLGTGRGPSRKQAEQRAARSALDLLFPEAAEEVR